MCQKKMFKQSSKNVLVILETEDKNGETAFLFVWLEDSWPYNLSHYVFAPLLYDSVTGSSNLNAYSVRSTNEENVVDSTFLVCSLDEFLEPKLL